MLKIMMAVIVVVVVMRIVVKVMKRVMMVIVVVVVVVFALVSSLPSCPAPWASSAIHELFCRQTMASLTEIAAFLLQGLSAVPELQLPSAAAFLLSYLAAVLGNIAIVAAVTHDARLHTPVYFFLKHLSLVGTCSVSTTLPRALVATMLGSREISPRACASQLFAFVCLGSTECFLITSMAFDRCLAIDRPLVYGVAMSPQTWASLVAVAWGSGLHFSAFHTANTFSLPFSSGCIIESCFALTALSYVRTLATAPQTHPAPGRGGPSPPALPTRPRSPVLRPGSSAYVQPTTSYSPTRGRAAAVFYSILTRTLNPLTCSLRNRDMKRALNKLYFRAPF
ncbi:olfactory receptor 2B11-like [Crocuta crocuta]